MSEMEKYFLLQNIFSYLGFGLLGLSIIIAIFHVIILPFIEELKEKKIKSKENNNE